MTEDEDISFENIVTWANDFKVDPVSMFSGPNLILIVAGAIITILFVWWIVLIFNRSRKESEEEDSDSDSSDEELDIIEEENK